MRYKSKTPSQPCYIEAMTDVCTSRPLAYSCKRIYIKQKECLLLLYLRVSLKMGGTRQRYWLGQPIGFALVFLPIEGGGLNVQRSKHSQRKCKHSIQPSNQRGTKGSWHRGIKYRVDFFWDLGPVISTSTSSHCLTAASCSPQETPQNTFVASSNGRISWFFRSVLWASLNFFFWLMCKYTQIQTAHWSFLYTKRV